MALLPAVLLLLLALGPPPRHAGAPGTALQPGGPQFRCRRSLDQLTSIKPKHIPKQKNCFMGAFEVTYAEARPVLRDNVPSLELQLTLEPERDARMMRYKLQLHSYDKGTSIHYKGDEGTGYSMCCAFVTGGECQWLPGKDGRLTETVVKCPLNEDLDEGTFQAFEQGSRPVVSGLITKPLHCKAGGLWEATLWLLDGFGGNYGKVTVWAQVPPDLFPIVDDASGRQPLNVVVADAAPSGAAVPEDIVSQEPPEVGSEL